MTTQQPGSSKEETIRDHQERMNRVLTHIQQHLDEPLTLDDLARVACFSPFHFHRIFAAYVGEPLNSHIRRLRLEFAAHRLCHTHQSITDIALSAGYDTHGAFTKAFTQFFQLSPSQFRKERATTYFWQPELRINSRTTTEATMQPEIRNMKERKVIFVRRTGPYQKAAKEAWDSVCSYAFPHGLVGPGAEFIGIGLDDPSITAEDKLRYDACITVQRDVKPEGEVGIQSISGGKYAVFLHKGPYSELKQAYDAAYGQWLPASGAKLRNATCFEIYLDDVAKTKPQNLRTEICIPIE
ncbi:MAG: AraC family transcriptional regulator [Lentisphaerota bacterium]